jgi:hypothetical protein
MKNIITSLVLTVFAAAAAAQPIVTESTNNNTSNNVNRSTSDSRSVSETTLKQPPPTAVAPAVTTINNDVCAVVASGAVQTQIFGISMGGTMRDMNCERIKLSKNLFDMGMKVAAVATLCQDERVFAAMMAAGTPCPVDGKIGAAAREEWNQRGVVVNNDHIGFYALPPAPQPKTVAPAAAAATPATVGCNYTGDDPVVMARVCGQ